MPVAVHDDCADGERCQLADEPAAVDERRTDPIGERTDLHGIFDEVMVQRYDPSRLGIDLDRGGKTLSLIERDHPQRVGE